MTADPAVAGQDATSLVAGHTATEMMTIAAARALSSKDVCFVGIGAPSAACNLARLTHAPGITLIYESGTIGARPSVLPLSIGDGELADTALTTVSVPEVFAYWLQGGRISVGFLAAAQMDRFGNINTTVIGPYHHPEVRLPGGGGAPEIATLCGEVFVTMPHTRRGLVESVDFVTSLGFGAGGDERALSGVTTKGPTLVVTDLCLMRPEEGSHEMVVTSLHPGIGRTDVREATGWEIRFSPDPTVTEPPTATELGTLRELQRRTDEAHHNG